jgi:hypothetical protein
MMGGGIELIVTGASNNNYWMAGGLRPGQAIAIDKCGNVRQIVPAGVAAQAEIPRPFLLRTGGQTYRQGSIGILRK